MLKRHGSSADELLPHDVVELILERLAVKVLLRFRCVSKKWKSTIDSRRFQEGQLICRRQSRGPDVLFICLACYGDDGLDRDGQRIVFGSSVARTIMLPISGSMFCHGSCDGLACVYCLYTPCCVVNASTAWYQTFPLSTFQQLLIERCNRKEYNFPIHKLGFGKDKVTGTYKPVWLYNSSGSGLDNVTTCEVFDFRTNAWRYLLPASPYLINAYHKPVYSDGSLHWFTECEEPKILSLDLHTETFQVICKAPFTHLPDPRRFTMCILDNLLCVSERNWPTQLIWSLDSSGGCKTWKKMCSLDLTKTSSWLEDSYFALSPVAILEKDKLLLQGRDCYDSLVIHDLHTKSYDVLFKPIGPLGPLYYFQSLSSVLPN